MDKKVFIMSDRIKVRKSYGKTELDIQKDIELLREWLKTQKHLPESPNDNMLEFFLINCKFSIENTKDNIDMYYSVRTLIPEFYTNCNPQLPENKRAWDYSCYCPIPKLTEDLHRIVIIKLKNAHLDKFNVNTMFIQFINVFEILVQEDSSLGIKFIIDLQHFKIGHILHMAPTAMKNSVIVLEKVVRGKVKEIDFINFPPYADKVLLLLKSFMKSKLRNRIHVLNSCDTLFERVPKEYLPSDYGGNQMSVEELCDFWKGKLEEFQERFDKLDTLKVNEALRPEPLKNSDILGYYGNFKKLDVD